MVATEVGRGSIHRCSSPIYSISRIGQDRIKYMVQQCLNFPFFFWFLIRLVSKTIHRSGWPTFQFRFREKITIQTLKRHEQIQGDEFNFSKLR